MAAAALPHRSGEPAVGVDAAVVVVAAAAAVDAVVLHSLDTAGPAVVAWHGVALAACEGVNREAASRLDEGCT